MASLHGYRVSMATDLLLKIASEKRYPRCEWAGKEKWAEGEKKEENFFFKCKRREMFGRGKNNGRII